jgi:hypothetical protein
MKRLVILIALATVMVLIIGCGQADFAKINIKSSRTEGLDPLAAEYLLILVMEIENLTDANLYIESSSPADEEGEKHLWFVLKDQDGNEYKAIYRSEIEINIFPMSVSPHTTTTGEMAFMIPKDASSVTLEVTQNVVGEKGTKVIYTQEISI